MTRDKLIPGVVLVLLGSAFLLNNYGVINFHFSNLFYLWPIFLIIGGINLMFAHNKSWWATIVKLLVVVIGLSLIIFGNFGYQNKFWPHIYYNNDDMGDRGITKIEGDKNFFLPYTAEARQVRLNISGGGTTYLLADTTNQLFNADTREFYGKYEFTHTQKDSAFVLDFKMKNSRGHGWGWNNNNQRSNSATFKLNVNPEWDIHVATGATDLNFDLSKFKVRSLDISGGAASFNVKLGQPLVVSNVKISTGVSDVKISIPANAACSINAHSGLSSNDFEGFTKKGDDTYETPGFAEAKNKFYIKINGGMSDFKVKRY